MISVCDTFFFLIGFVALGLSAWVSVNVWLGDSHWLCFE